MKNIAIVGSRKYPRLDLVTRLVWGILEPRRHIITGDAAGVDATVAEWVALLAKNESSSHSLEVIRAMWSRHGKAAGTIRNAEIIKRAEAVIAFWDGASAGTADTIQAATAKDLPIYIYDATGRLLPDPPCLYGPAPKQYLPDMSGPEYLPLSDPLSKAEPATARARPLVV
jgi:hypothetical protein